VRKRVRDLGLDSDKVAYTPLGGVKIVTPREWVAILA